MLGHNVCCAVKYDNLEVSLFFVSYTNPEFKERPVSPQYYCLARECHEHTEGMEMRCKPVTWQTWQEYYYI